MKSDNLQLNLLKSWYANMSVGLTTTIVINEALYTVKNIRISTDILWRVFLSLTEPVPYKLTFLSVNWQNNAMGATGSLIIIPSIYGYKRIGLYGNSSVKIWKLDTKYQWVYGCFLQCTWQCVPYSSTIATTTSPTLTDQRYWSSCRGRRAPAGPQMA